MGVEHGVIGGAYVDVDPDELSSSNFANSANLAALSCPTAAPVCRTSRTLRSPSSERPACESRISPAVTEGLPPAVGEALFFAHAFVFVLGPVSSLHRILGFSLVLMYLNPIVVPGFTPPVPFASFPSIVFRLLSFEEPFPTDSCSPTALFTGIPASKNPGGSASLKSHPVLFTRRRPQRREGDEAGLLRCGVAGGEDIDFLRSLGRGYGELSFIPVYGFVGDTSKLRRGADRADGSVPPKSNVLGQSNPCPSRSIGNPEIMLGLGTTDPIDPVRSRDEKLKCLARDFPASPMLERFGGEIAGDEPGEARAMRLGLFAGGDSGCLRDPKLDMDIEAGLKGCTNTCVRALSAMHGAAWAGVLRVGLAIDRVPTVFANLVLTAGLKPGGVIA